MTRETRERLLLLGAGASLAVAALLLLTPGRRTRSDGEEPLGGPSSQRGRSSQGGRSPAAAPTSPPSQSPQPAWKTFGDGLRDEWSEWMERRTPPEVDPDLLRATVREVPGGEAVQVGLLAPGIVELVGTVEGPEAGRALLSAAAGAPGVRTVVNRLWVQGDVE